MVMVHSKNNGTCTRFFLHNNYEYIVTHLFLKKLFSKHDLVYCIDFVNV